MSVFDIISLFGGLALFLYGISMMDQGLQRASGGRLEQLLEKLTGNIWKGIFLGLMVTAAIQSSSATTVIVVGLVNARILKLRQAIGVIMGANIGTTVTSHLIRLADIDEAGAALSLLKPTALAPLAAIAGFMVYLSAKKNDRRELGVVLLGFGILFTGMFAMEAAVSPLRGSPEFAEIFAGLSNPVLGVLAGAGITAVIQSSSASVGILQALASTGAITFAAAAPIIMGQNIGTCVTAMLASLSAGKNAKRAALVHVAFNVMGTVLFLTAVYAIEYTMGLPFWNQPITRGGIADFHTVFNVLTTIALIPFAGGLERIAFLIIKAEGEDYPDSDELSMLDERFLGAPAYAVQQARGAVENMAALALGNFTRSTELLGEFDKKKLEYAREVEDTLDRLQGRVDRFLLGVARHELTETESVALSEVLQVVNEFERIGDHCDNICDVAEQMAEKSLEFSAVAQKEMDAVIDAVHEILGFAVKGYKERDLNLAGIVEPLEEVIDILVETLKVRHGERLREGLCTADNAFPFVELLYNLERIADHCSNVGVHVISYGGVEVMDRHEYLRSMHSAMTPEYRQRFEMYDKKYFERIKQA